ncbi:hypothetical protein G3M48_005656 [Beauveria asiatica]|uniref:Carrier domain-containing protein n=1 Tax=Beauveria asiatica TaxID=1069075 RepID=A0AAW0RQN3_9HYPO
MPPTPDLASSRDSRGAGSALEPIAIIGAACRFSGCASSQAGLWQMLSSGMTGWSAHAGSRFVADAFWHPTANRSGTFNTRGLHLLRQDPAVFDNDFFGISGLEAEAIDPNQRMMLELAYETFENAGISMEQLQGSHTGVYCAVPYNDYDHIIARDPETSPVYRFTGTGPALMANRVSYVFDLKGPSMSIDTACSSTLVALHEACRALRAGDAAQMLIGGSNLILDPDKLTVMSSMQFLSDSGRCFSFDARGSGYGRGEGVAAVLLKPLHAAMRDGDAIRGLIRGSAVGSDGKTSGITMPSPDAQYHTIMRAYESAGLDPCNTLYVEAHGTGTAAGDECEMTAFHRAFCQNRKGNLLVNSVKANLGHTEAVSGLAGLFKALMMLERGMITPHPTLETVNRKLDLVNRGIEVPERLIGWPQNMARRASLNGSGYGGTNAHVILEAWPPHCQSTDGNKSNVGSGSLATNSEALDEISATNSMHGVHKPHIRVFVWSHQRELGLSRMAAVWRRFLRAAQVNKDGPDLHSLAYTLSCRRSKLAYRCALVASNLDELVDGVGRLAIGTPRPRKALLNPRVCFFFTGNLGTGWSLVDELAKPEHETRIHDAELCQPSCTALQIALVDLLRSWHVRPEFVCGHSSGEIAAAYAAGALTASDAIKVAYHRGQAVQYLARIAPGRRGSMLAVGLGEEDARRHLTAWHQGKVTVACINSPGSVTLSGDESAIDSIASELRAAKVFCRKLRVGVAYHSQHMKLVESFYRSAIRDIVARDGKPGVKMVSSVTGRLVTGRQLGSLYWVQNLLSPVLFSDAVSEILSLAGDQTASGVVRSNIMVEIGPHSALKSPMMQIFKHKTAMHLANYLSCLTRDVDGRKTCLQLAADLFMLGASIDVNSANKIDNNNNNTKDTSFPQAQVLTNLPSYNWHHDSRHWNESRRSAAYRLREDPRHELLGNPTADNVSQEPSWHHYLRLSELPWLKGHCVDQQVVFPAAGYVCMMIEAMKKIAFPYGWRDKVIKLSKVSIDRPLLIRGEDQDVLGTEVITSARPYAPCSYRTEAKAWEFRIFSISPANEATEHCRGMATVVDAHDQNLLYQLQLKDAQDGNGDTADGWESREPIGLYRILKVAGAEYSGPFACLEAIKIQPWHCRATIQVPDVASTMPSQYQQLQMLHPTVLDGCFHACLAALWQADALETALVITEIEEMTVSTNMDLGPGQRLFVRSTARTFGLDKYSGDIVVSDTNLSDADNGMGQNWIRVKGLRLAPSQGFDQARTDEAEESRQCHRIEWRVDPFLTLPHVLAQHCRRQLDELRSPSLRRQGDAFCQSAIARQMFQLNALADKASVAPEHLQFYLQWLRSQDTLGAPIADADLENAAMAMGAAGEALLAIDENLQQLLLGRVDGLSLLLERDLLGRLHAEDDCVNRCHHQLVEYMRLVKFKMGRLRILEIGGGTGNLTIPVMKALFSESRHGRQPGTSQGLYVLTDTSSVYFASLQETLQEFSSVMQYRTFDMEKPPGDQGLELGSFDVILASNVIHAAANIGQGLRNLKQLLGPRGQIVMVEVTEPSLRWTMTLGSLAGWWVGAGSSKATPPFMNTSQWDSVLQSSGFSGVSVEMKDYEAPGDHECSLLVTHQIDGSASDSGAARCHSLSHILLIRGTEPDETKTALTIRDAMVFQCLNNETRIDMTTASELVPCAELASTLLVFLPGTLQECWIAPSEACWYNIRDSITSARSVLLVTKDGAVNCSGPDGAIVSGLGRALRAENHDLDLFTLDLGHDSPDHVIAAHFVQVYRSLVDPQRTTPHSLWEWEVAAREQCILIPRLVQDSKMHDWVQDSVSKYHPRYEIIKSSDNRALKLRVGPSKTLDSLYWADAPSHSQSRQGSQVRVRVENVALNFKDLMTIMGELPGLSTILIEGSGIVTDTGDDMSPSCSLQAGDRVCFFAADGLATRCNLDVNHVAKIPDGMSMQAAAAIPVAYSTSLFALRDVARLRPGESVLIHSGAGAVGQVAIALAQHLQAGMILVTVGRPERREFIEKKFGIPAHHIVSNRHATFSQRILQLTGGAGVNVALNSLAGDAIQETLSVMAPFGRFVEIGKKDMLVNTKLNMQQLENNISLSTVDMTLVAARRPATFQELLSTSLHLIHTKAVHLLEPITAKPAAEVANQFRTMQAGKHLGKLILNLKSSEVLKVQPATPSRATLQSNKSYLVVGGTGGLGKAIIRLLVKMGAKRIVTLSRSGAAAAGMSAFVKEMATAGVQVMAVKGSVLDNSSLDEVKAAAGDMPIKGVIQAAMALHDAAFEQMSHSEWCDGIHPKVQGTISLDRNTSKLDFLILLSSYHGIVGMPGQANYCAANTFLDAFARQKASLGQPARSIDLGLIHNEGTVAEIEAVGRNQHAHGLRPYGVNVLFALINYCIQNPVAASPGEAQILCGGRRADPTSSAPEAASRQRPDMRFAHAWRSSSGSSSRAAHGKPALGGMAVQSALKAAATPQAAVEAVFAGLKQKLAGMLSISIDDVQADRSVASYGVDSLISVELRNWVRDELAAQIQSIELMSSLSMMQLAETMARRSRLVSAVLFNGADADA